MKDFFAARRRWNSGVAAMRSHSDGSIGRREVFSFSGGILLGPRFGHRDVLMLAMYGSHFARVGQKPHT